MVALAASFGWLGVDARFPALGMADTVRGIVTGIDFSDALLEGMLGLLLFAGALHVKLGDLRQEWLAVFLMATIGIGLSTVVAGVGFSWITGMPLLIALVFGALISPTDPVAVLGVRARPTCSGRWKPRSPGKACSTTPPPSCWPVW